MKISVVIPTFKRPELLLRCLTALKDQSFLPGEYEIIVVTDGPDAVTSGEVSFFINQYLLTNVIVTGLAQKGGPAAARNKGARLAKGELIVFTDDDCIPDVHWLQAYWSASGSRDTEYGVFTGRTIVPRRPVPTDYEKNIANLETAEFITANCACTKPAFDKLRGFDEEFPVAWREDSEFQFRVIGAGIPVIKVSGAVVVHPVRKAPWGISLREQKKSMFNALLHKKHPLLYKKKISAQPLWNYYAIIFSFISAGICFANDRPLPAYFLIFVWLLLVTQFAYKRLEKTSKKTGHVIEIIVTSILIPYLSVFWTLYGSFTYKKLLL